MSRARSNTTSVATAAVCAWGGVALASYYIRLAQRRRNAAREARVAKEGGLLPQAKNVVHALELRALKHGSKLALEGADLQRYSWNNYYNEVKAFAMALHSLKSDAAGDNCGVAVHALNQPKWFFAAVGALAAGWTVSGIYLTNSYNQAAHVIKTSGVRVLVLEDANLLESTYKDVHKSFPDLLIVLMNGKIGKESDKIFSYEEFIAKGSSAAGASLKAPEDLEDSAATTLVYTSGTTGNPKAVELTHVNIHSVCAMMHARIPLSEDTVVVSYLPLSHIAAMGIDVFSAIYCGACVHFADANALKGSLKDTLVRVRPTLFFGVPRVWEKMAQAMKAAAQKSYSKPVAGSVLKTIGGAAKAVGAAWWSSTTPELLRCSLLTVPMGLFRVIAFRKVHKGCGLDRCKLLYTGAAPLSDETHSYFRSLDMPLLEVFGMSESCGAIAVCGPNDGARPIGSCGRGLPLGNLQIAKDGEVLWQGTNNMRGYKDLSEETSKVLSQSGQLHTGDLGSIDTQTGYLSITGRKKDIIITAGGENVAPVPIEETLLSLLREKAGNVILVGDRRKYLSILVAPLPPSDGENQPKLPTMKEMENAIAVYNDKFAKSRAQRVQRAHAIPAPFLVETGELTPTMKVKRSFVYKKYSEEIELMYIS